MLFLIAVRMVFPEVHGPLAETVAGEPFVVPLAVPYVAGPSTLATVLLLTSREPGRHRDWLIAISAAWAASALQMVLDGEAPLHFPLGKYVVKKLRDKAAALTREAEKWDAVAAATEFSA